MVWHLEACFLVKNNTHIKGNHIKELKVNVYFQKKPFLNCPTCNCKCGGRGGGHSGGRGGGRGGGGRGGHNHRGGKGGGIAA